MTDLKQLVGTSDQQIVYHHMHIQLYVSINLKKKYFLEFHTLNFAWLKLTEFNTQYTSG